MATESESEQRPLQGRTVLVTGGTGGIGYQTARVLARWGAQVLITGREIDAGERAAAAIRRQSGREVVRFLPADHATVGGNQQLADQVRAAFPSLDVLVNNVGGLYRRRWETADGYEATLAMNFVGPFTLTSELLPLLQANAPARCLNVVSAGFKMRSRSPEQAGRRVAALVASPLAATATGAYFEAKPTPRRLSARELDRQLQERAWQLGCELVAEARTCSRAR
jgi:NAD(P)-dependent dehydrogenase (short-subunit alcohol dehydrogenase family)